MPLEKTLYWRSYQPSASEHSTQTRFIARRAKAVNNLHEETSLAAGSVADDDELPTDLRHYDVVKRAIAEYEGGSEAVEEATGRVG